jgi:hypothetical protein
MKLVLELEGTWDQIKEQLDNKITNPEQLISELMQEANDSFPSILESSALKFSRKSNTGLVTRGKVEL